MFREFSDASRLTSGWKLPPAVHKAPSPFSCSSVPTRRNFLRCAVGLGTGLLGYIASPKHAESQGFVYNPRAALFESYLQRRGDIGATLQECRKDPQNFHPRVAAWVHMIDIAAAMPDHRERFSFVNGWCNGMIRYDEGKEQYSKTVSISDVPDWYRPALETLMIGWELCSGITMLKYETLQQTGIPKNDLMVFLVTSQDTSRNETGAHMALAAKINGDLWMLETIVDDINPAMPDRYKSLQKISSIEVIDSYFDPGGSALFSRTMIFTPRCLFSEADYLLCIPQPRFGAPGPKTYLFNLTPLNSPLVQSINDVYDLREPVPRSPGVASAIPFPIPSAHP